METGRTGSAIGGRRSKLILAEEAVRLAESFLSPRAYVLLPSGDAVPCVAAVPTVVCDKMFEAKARARGFPSRLSAPMRADRFWDLLLFCVSLRSAGGGRETVVNLAIRPSRTLSYA